MNDGMVHETNEFGDELWTLFSIQQKYKFDYLSYLIDDFSQHRIKRFEKGYMLPHWSKNNPHFGQLIKIKLKKTKKRCDIFVEEAMGAHSHSVVPHLFSKRFLNINDSYCFIYNQSYVL